MTLKKLLLSLACCLLSVASARAAVIFSGDGTTLTLTVTSPISIVATAPTGFRPLFTFRDAFAAPPAGAFGVAFSSGSISYTVTPFGGVAGAPIAVDYSHFGVGSPDVLGTDFLMGSTGGGPIAAGDTLTLLPGTISFPGTSAGTNPTIAFLVSDADGSRMSADFALSAVPEPTNVLFTGLLLGSASLLRFRTRRPLSA